MILLKNKAPKILKPNNITIDLIRVKNNRKVNIN